MIEAKSSYIHKKFWTWIFSRILKKRFNKFTRIGINNLNEWENKINKSTPLILAGNHSSWYDAVLPVVISFSDYKFDAYAMMEDLQIIKYKFFSKIGCFSINLKNSKSAAISLRYTINLLNNKKRVLSVSYTHLTLPTSDLV